jgi:putative tryptophan/tyrosine transport system substrate-binding protein
VPQVARVAFLFNPANPFFTLDLPNLETDARALGLQLQPVAVCQADEFDGAFATIIEHRPNALYLGDDGLLNRHLQPIMHFATTHQLPTMGTRRKTAEAGSLMAFGYSRRELIQRAAVYVDKILKGPSLVICPSSGPRHSSWSSTSRRPRPWPSPCPLAPLPGDRGDPLSLEVGGSQGWLWTNARIVSAIPEG